MTRRSLLMLVFLAALAVLAIVVLRDVRVPPHLNPWAPLRLDESPGFLTRYKLSRASDDASLCRSVLSQAPWLYSPIDDEVTQPGCGYTNAVRIQSMTAALNAPFAASCREALSLALWERHVLQPAAHRHFGEPVTRIEHFGSYSCRGVYGRPAARKSHHATADALDVAGFVIGDSHRIRVISDWDNSGSEGRFLREVHAGACQFFDSVMGPEYNEAHRDHFHLDRGRFRVCR